MSWGTKFLNPSRLYLDICCIIVFNPIWGYSLLAFKPFCFECFGHLTTRASLAPRPPVGLFFWSKLFELRWQPVRPLGCFLG